MGIASIGVIRRQGMNLFKSFVEKAIEQDKRNNFAESKVENKRIPKCFKEFYRLYNPIDVEVEIDNRFVHFIPAEELDRISEEYNLESNCFIFATSEGDPIYYRDGKIYSCVFGRDGIIEEVLSDDLMSFFKI